MTRKPEMEILARLDALFEDPTRFTEGMLALDRQGNAVGVDSPTAYRFCAEGGINMIALQLFSTETAERHAEAAKRIMLECAARVLPRRVSWFERYGRRVIGRQSARYKFVHQLNDVEGLPGVRKVLKEAVHA